MKNETDFTKDPFDTEHRAEGLAGMLQDVVKGLMQKDKNCTPVGELVHFALNDNYSTFFSGHLMAKAAIRHYFENIPMANEATQLSCLISFMYEQQGDGDNDAKTFLEYFVRWPVLPLMFKNTIDYAEPDNKTLVCQFLFEIFIGGFGMKNAMDTLDVYMQHVNAFLDAGN